jgi:hypothetical protein
MTVNNADSTITYLANGSTTEWVFSFPGIDPTFIEVFLTDAGGGQVQLNPSQYQVILNPTIDPNPTSQGGKVIYPIIGSPLANGNTLTIVRNLPVEQTVSLSNQSIIYPTVIEEEFDYLTLLTRVGSEGISRAFKVGFNDPIPAIVPPVAERANQGAFFDSLGNLTPGGIPGPGVFISAAMTPVVQAVSIASARNLMGVYSKAEVDALVSLLYSTGDLKPTHKTVADPGWIIWSDGTIGNAGSGATILASDTTANLFALYFNFYSDALCPLRTSSGAGGINRANFANAAAAFGTPNFCRMTMPRGAGRALCLAGAGGGLTNRILGSTIGAETETPTLPKTASHQHPSGGQLTNFTPAELSVPYQVGSGGGMDINRTIPTGVEGGGQPFNIMNPTAFVNVMVRL